ncbi:MAG: hypothetical protein HRU28_15485 [Rhizobiales bacterium]|nr:hypothetical protein [Hyphomicrobiales bacterium]
MEFTGVYKEQLEQRFQHELSVIKLQRLDEKDSELKVMDVIRSHYMIANFFVEAGGGGMLDVGTKDINLLISAVSRQNTGFNGSYKWNTVFEKAATLLKPLHSLRQLKD